jgi:hypothetical protein
MGAASQLQIGSLYPAANATFSFSSFTANGSTDKAEVVFEAFEDATITRLGLRIGTITNSVTWKIGLQGVDASSNPDGTFLGGASPASATFNPTSLSWASGDWRWVTLDNSYSVTRGTKYAWVVEYSSGTLGSQVINHYGSWSGASGAPFAITNDAGSRTRQGNALPIFGYGSSTKAYGFPLENSAEAVYNSGSTPDEYALAWNLPTQFGSTYKVAGVRMGQIRIGNASQTWTMTLYDSDGTTVLQQAQKDSDYWESASAARGATFFFDETTLSTLNTGSNYKISFLPDNASINLRPTYYDVDAAADWDAWPGGQNFWVSSRTNAGAWTDTTTRRFNFDLIIDDITAPSGGSGAIIIPGGMGQFGVAIH